MPKVRLVGIAQGAFEPFYRTQDIRMQPLHALGESRVEGGDFEAVGCGFDASTYLEAFGSKGIPKLGEAVVIQYAKDVSNVFSAGLAKEVCNPVSSSTFFAHSSNASRFSSIYAWRL